MAPDLIEDLTYVILYSSQRGSNPTLQATGLLEWTLIQACLFH